MLYSGCHRYCLSVLVCDPALASGEIQTKCLKLVLFGSDAEQLVGSPVDALLPAMQEERASLPSQILTIEGKIIESRISVNPRCLDDGIISYQVNRLITSNTAIINVPTKGKLYITFFLLVSQDYFCFLETNIYITQ
jgi:uncharacterized membrane protein